MKRTESTSSAQAPKKTQPEEFDLVILGGGTDSRAGAEQGSAVRGKDELRESQSFALRQPRL